MIKRLKSWRAWRRYGSDLEGPDHDSRRRDRRGFGARARRRRRTSRVLVVLLASLVVSLLALEYATGDTFGVFAPLEADSSSPQSADEPEIPAAAVEADEGVPVASEPAPEATDDASPAAVAYRLVASEIPGMDPGSVEGAYESRLDPSWVSVRLTAPSGDEGTYVVFLEKTGDDVWKARKSVRADEPEAPEYERVVLDGVVPEDLVDSLYPQSPLMSDATDGGDASGLLTEPVQTRDLPDDVEGAEPPTPRTATDEVPEEDLEAVEGGLEGALKTVEDYAGDYEGTAGVYAVDLTEGYGYGVNSDETFFGASVMKIPLMVAVYRKMDEGEFTLSDSFETEPGDWAGGAGWLQWEEPGTAHTVQDYLWMMMTQSDNVATNALLRRVGGPEYVNEVSASLGAEDTFLYQQITSERAAVPSLDNRTTPRDMAKILSAIATGQAASPVSCQDMVDLMGQNELQSSIKDGLPEDVEAAKKGGWLYKVYDEAGIVFHEDRPYVISIFSKHGSEDVEVGKKLMKDLSESVYEAQDGL